MGHIHSDPVPTPIVRRQIGGETGADALCTYDAILQVWQRKSGDAPPHAWADWNGRTGGGRLLANHPRARLALFVRPNGESWCTDSVRSEIQRMAAAVGEDPREFGGKSLRIGGATDLREALGDDEKSSRLIERRGRWCSEIARVYQRGRLETQLAGSMAMGSAGGVDMESVCLGWVQPS